MFSSSHFVIKFTRNYFKKGQSGRPKFDINEETLIELRTLGYNWNEIAGMLLVSHWTIQKWWRKRAPLCSLAQKTIFDLGTELEAAEWIKFLVLETRFGSNSSRTHLLILSCSFALFVSSCLYFPACPVIRISGSQPPSTIASRSSPNCWTCFVVEVAVRCWLWGKSSLK